MENMETLEQMEFGFAENIDEQNRRNSFEHELDMVDKGIAYGCGTFFVLAALYSIWETIYNFPN